jgi:2-oxo-4-hydroxy-4-carboxy-5-ureidoimidazoline decarboxylase
MNAVLQRWNALGADEAAQQILPCCGSQAWARAMAARRPIADEGELLAASDKTWDNLAQSDWMEAFRSHPRIGEKHAASRTQSGEWSAEEQSRALADDDLNSALKQANRDYEERFGHIFIVCASGKSAREILESLRRRLRNDSTTELFEAAEQQRRITHIRLRKWLQD